MFKNFIEWLKADLKTVGISVAAITALAVVVSVAVWIGNRRIDSIPAADGPSTEVTVQTVPTYKIPAYVPTGSITVEDEAVETLPLPEEFDLLQATDELETELLDPAAITPPAVAPTPAPKTKRKLVSRRSELGEACAFLMGNAFSYCEF